jgi:hypothetical protein
LHICEPVHILPASVQSAQATPLAPHAVSVFPGTHVAPLRHPAQTHLFSEHVSPVVVHETQVLPPLPQRSSALPGLQVVPVQQPVAQEVESQTHVPMEHCCPAPQTMPRFCH